MQGCDSFAPATRTQSPPNPQSPISHSRRSPRRFRSATDLASVSRTHSIPRRPDPRIQGLPSSPTPPKPYDPPPSPRSTIQLDRLLILSNLIITHRCRRWTSWRPQPSPGGHITFRGGCRPSSGEKSLGRAKFKRGVVIYGLAGAPLFGGRRIDGGESSCAAGADWVIFYDSFVLNDGTDSRRKGGRSVVKLRGGGL